MKKLFVLFALMVIAFTSYAQVYKMYKTRNYHNQLRLNTMTGEVQQIQDDGQSWEICSAREILGDKEGRFRLYETQNMWTFIMLDTYTCLLYTSFENSPHKERFRVLKAPVLLPQFVYRETQHTNLRSVAVPDRHVRETAQGSPCQDGGVSIRD